MKKIITKMLIVGAVASVVLLSGCVTENKYNALEQEYQQVQAALSADRHRSFFLRAS